jgi:hypothetical protein
VSDWLVNVHACWALVESARATGAAAIDIATAPAASSGAMKGTLIVMVSHFLSKTERIVSVRCSAMAPKLFPADSVLSVTSSHAAHGQINERVRGRVVVEGLVARDQSVPFGESAGQPWRGPHAAVNAALIEWITSETFNGAANGPFYCQLEWCGWRWPVSRRRADSAVRRNDPTVNSYGVTADPRRGRAEPPASGDGGDGQLSARIADPRTGPA